MILLFAGICQSALQTGQASLSVFHDMQYQDKQNIVLTPSYRSGQVWSVVQISITLSMASPRASPA